MKALSKSSSEERGVSAIDSLLSFAVLEFVGFCKSFDSADYIKRSIFKALMIYKWQTSKRNNSHEMS